MAELDLVELRKCLVATNRCRRCDCPSCDDGYENHSHSCTGGTGCIETPERLRARITGLVHLCLEAAALLSRLEQHKCAACGRVNADPRPWDKDEVRCPDCQDSDRPPMLSASPPPPGGRGRDEDGAESILSDAPSPCTSADVVGTADVGSLPMPWRRFVVSAWEFLSDWHKGDFGLDGLAKHDAQSMSDAWPGPTQEDCPMCLGRGEVGGFVRWGEAGSWESEPCPQCQPPSAAGQSLNELAQDGATLVPLTAEMARAQADLHAEQAAAIADLTGKLAKAAEGMRAACDLLAERTYDNPARSPGHNARLTLEGVLREIEHAG